MFNNGLNINNIDPSSLGLKMGKCARARLCSAKFVQRCKKYYNTCSSLLLLVTTSICTQSTLPTIILFMALVNLSFAILGEDN